MTQTKHEWQDNLEIRSAVLLKLARNGNEQSTFDSFDSGTRTKIETRNKWQIDTRQWRSLLKLVLHLTRHN